MTCIAGLVKGQRVLVGGDSAGTTGGWDIVIRSDPKVFHFGPFVVGFTTSYRMGQLIQYSLKLPWLELARDTSGLRTPRDGEVRSDPFRYMVTEFVEAVRKCLKDGGFSTKEKERESGGQFLVGFMGKLFLIDDDFQIGEMADGIHAIGIGANYAIGSLHTSGQMMPEIDAQKRLQMSLEAAAARSAAVRGPFIIEECQNPFDEKW